MWKKTRARLNSVGVSSCTVHALDMKTSRRGRLAGKGSGSHHRSDEGALQNGGAQDEVGHLAASFACPQCDKVFGSAGKLNQHLCIHTGERPFKCDACDKAFSSRFKLMRHTLIHSDERRYKCPHCDRCFHRKDHLKNHQQVHNPNKAVYKCDECTKEYNSRLSYRKHVAVHAAQGGALDCRLCGQRFLTTDEVLYHLKVHAGSRATKSPAEKKFQCDFCERRFFTRKDVKRHLVVHTGRRDFLCQFCPQRFGRKDHLVRHIKKGHGPPVASALLTQSLDLAPYLHAVSLGKDASSDDASSGFSSPDCSHALAKFAATSPEHVLLHNPPSLAHHKPVERFDSSLVGGAMPGFGMSLPLVGYQQEAAPSDYKMYDDVTIKVERPEGPADHGTQLSPGLMDITHLLGFFPQSSLTTTATTTTPRPQSPAYLPPSMGITPLPQFRHAFH